MSEYTHFCPWCDARFLYPPEGGRCPFCGGPGVKRIEKDPVPKAQTYPPVPERPLNMYRENDYYVLPTKNPLRTAKRWAFHTLGYRLTMIMACIVLLLVISWQIYIAFFTTAKQGTHNAPIPTIQPVKPFKESVRPFATYQFFDAQESEVLRIQKNVINVTVLGDGYGARYMRTYAVILDRSTWKKVEQIFSVTGFTPDETSCTIEVDTATYNINKHQGFILAAYPGTIYIVDDDNTLWKHVFSDHLLISIPEAQARLQTSIKPNPELSLTLR